MEAGGRVMHGAITEEHSFCTSYLMIKSNALSDLDQQSQSHPNP